MPDPIDDPSPSDHPPLDEEAPPPTATIPLVVPVELPAPTAAPLDTPMEASLAISPEIIAPAKALPSLAQLANQVKIIIAGNDIQTLTPKLVRASLETHFHLAEDALFGLKNELKKMMTDIVMTTTESKTKTNEQTNDQHQQAEQAATGGVSAPTPGGRNSEGRKAATAPTPHTPQTRSAKRARRTYEESDDDDLAGGGDGGAGGAGDGEEDESADESGSNRKLSSASGSKKSASKRPGVKKTQGAMMTKAYFLENAPTFASQIGHVKFDLAPREYATGSCGWFYGSKLELNVGEKTVLCQLTLNCTVVGSKTWKKGKPTPEKKEEDGDAADAKEEDKEEDNDD